MHFVMRALLSSALIGLASGSARADAQVWKHIRDSVTKRADAHKKAVDSSLVHTAVGAADSTLEKTQRGVGAVLTTSGSLVDTALNRTERSVSSVFHGRDSTSERLKADVARGRAVVPGIVFAPSAAVLDSTAKKPLHLLAQAITAQAPAAFLIEGHTDPSGDPAADQALSEQRAAAVKTALVALGVPSAHLFSMGYGATRPLATSSGAAPSSARIEVARMQ